MRHLRIVLLTLLCVTCDAKRSPCTASQHGTLPVDWQAELRKAQAGIKKNPKSAFWHNQAGVAYDALGDFEKAVRELKLASSLDPTNPIDDYALYALYKRKGMRAQQRVVLLSALEKDSQNPVGRFELGFVLETEKHWTDSIREYQTAKRLAAAVTGHEYIDPRGNPYEIDGVRDEVDKAIERVTKLDVSNHHEN